MKHILALGAALVFLGWGQTRVNTKQLGRINGDGILVQTAEGLKTAFPLPGFIYPVGGTQAQLIGDGARKLIIGEVPVRQPDGRYLLAYRPNPAGLAVYWNGLRLMPDAFTLIWLDPNKLPDRFEIRGSLASDKVLVDYLVGTASYGTNP